MAVLEVSIAILWLESLEITPLQINAVAQIIYLLRVTWQARKNQKWKFIMKWFTLLINWL